MEEQYTQLNAHTLREAGLASVTACEHKQESVALEDTWCELQTVDCQDYAITGFSYALGLLAVLVLVSGFMQF